MSDAPTTSAAGRIDAIQRRAAAIRLNLNALCQQAGVNRSTFTRWQLGQTGPTCRALDDIEAALAREEQRLLADLVARYPDAAAALLQHKAAA
jgi:transcriptional regulator with XRE-family HTH domain